jgi:hypothetical protein
VIDASGRDTLLSNQFDAKQRNRKHASAALFGHFANAERTARALRGQHHAVLVRPRLVLVHPAEGRHPASAPWPRPRYFKRRKGASSKTF